MQFRGHGHERSPIVAVVGITILQERRTERALAKLKDLSGPRALVIRNGVEQRIAGREVVIGDLVLLREGDRVPADGIVLSATALGVSMRASYPAHVTSEGIRT